MPLSVVTPLARMWPVWLGQDAVEEAHLKSLLRPYPAEDMRMWPVSVRVGSVKNNDPLLIEPIESAEWPRS
jgi:putative SOS response-associated peptidase YedK